ncbi:UDP-N-acetylglucosamine 1-carboxyvinyltransferase [Enterobacteriaceae endosymbiont of Neohaemonia nigricornis]|uniref:UDP-N-acetylglucosamine 1-carboxyvinyltransferase n=1 Tax=Enterobacteriaceae endosymbiont of Neohaemonia nigricornis TaxID=2675792 RepID=UPI0014492BE3|nr:UDP-N-acetylglucosamine 1-carboxyvinyltransferase [Enterobacteriaceae endosymbiont of Neohaemonia nigricornis]QJC30612.1 UDP-N-acetylglucosamine 1-carboxyvinyltransferase [Enterobacteriaceae endosymbiont of Neohaemonia nigricornis]
MDKFIIRGPVKLQGEVKISGSKNSALPILFASMLVKNKVRIQNIPYIQDVSTTINLLIHLGINIKQGKVLILDAKNVNKFYAPDYLVQNIRASIWLMSTLLIRLGKFSISFPGGCSIGTRPIDLHIKGLCKLGAIINIKNNTIYGYLPNKIKGAHIIMEKVSVGATINIILLAIFADTITIIDNPAKEPEIQDVVNFLNFMGAKIQGVGTHRIIIQGITTLKGTKKIYKIIPDRIETGTFLIAAAINRSKIICRNTNPKHLINVLEKLKQTGADIKYGKTWCSLDMHGKRPKAINITTGPYPKFPTDMQTQFVVLNSIAQGISNITETIFENRFLYINELIKMGAKIYLKNQTLTCYGTNNLKSAIVTATDLRSAVSLILAGCISIGVTIINNINYVDRGYENIIKKLSLLGAKIKRIK